MGEGGHKLAPYNATIQTSFFITLWSMSKAEKL